MVPSVLSRPLPAGALALLCWLLALMTSPLAQARSLMTDGGQMGAPQLIMIFDNRTVRDGETVPIGAARDESHKEASVACLATRVAADVALAFPFYAENANLLDVPTSDCKAPAGFQGEGAVAICKKIGLETGGFLKLQCVLSHPNVTGSLASVTANFTFTHVGDPVTEEIRPSTTPLLPSIFQQAFPDHQTVPMSKNAPQHSGSTTPLVSAILSVSCLVLTLLL